MNKLLQISAVIALLGFPFAVLGFRMDLFGFGVSASIIKWSVFLALGLFVLSMIVTFWKRRSNPGLAKSARLAAWIAMVPILGVAALKFGADGVPPIHNISTDIENPPVFDVITEVRAAEHNPLAYNAEVLGPVQSQAYPAVRTLASSLAKPAAVERAAALAVELGWDVVNVNAEAGIVEATDTTKLWGFKDDIVVRVTSTEAGSLIDLRSVSRIGVSDLGANAKRITEFLDAFKTAG
ncbi:hypothetical protein GCM10008090_26330 [Arenicella chitinivorans]|uniref:DUF1499 domain-containing protein n=1 Tax=Arenicella chitinivorans TaxID=1329800 RepID=A0A918RZN1_9GAMM|nr:DUF1499 domain-containing protein [Arenicella chitinivorans]GHA15500.1 hypothetical protein GCM10008090_26330 [Arenicella chitinivorans]